MEANRFGFGGSLPPAFKFDPTDADIVAYYLLPRALNLHNPYADAVLEGDPASAPPCEILEGNLGHAFFFSPATDPSRNAGRKRRSFPGGTWQGQKGCEGTVTLQRPGGGEVDVTYRRYDLSFYRVEDGVRSSRSSGYVMHEYEILSPPLPGVLTRIKAPKKKKAKRRPVALAAAAAAKQQQVPDPEQAGPSNGQGFSGAQGAAPYGGGMVENAGYHGVALQYVLPEAYSGESYSYDAAQAHAFCGGGMVDTSGAYYDPGSGYVPDCGGDYSNYYADYQPWQYQQDPSNQYLAGDDGFSGEQQAGALCGSSDKGSVLGTDTSANSTISLCGDDIRFDHTLVLDDEGRMTPVIRQ